VAFKETKEIVELMDKIVDQKGIDRSDFIREAIRRRLAELSFLSSDAKKSLGIAVRGDSKT
jgi:metal-responsive CopG/Arc/MetJ family transcriptional regulator